jgi:hypothetical protein
MRARGGQSTTFARPCHQYCTWFNQTQFCWRFELLLDLLPRRGHAGFPVGRRQQLVGRAVQEIADQPPVHLIVLDVEYGLGARAVLPERAPDPLR